MGIPVPGQRLGWRVDAPGRLRMWPVRADRPVGGAECVAVRGCGDCHALCPDAGCGGQSWLACRRRGVGSLAAMLCPDVRIWCFRACWGAGFCPDCGIWAFRACWGAGSCPDLRFRADSDSWDLAPPPNMRGTYPVPYLGTPVPGESTSKKRFRKDCGHQELPGRNPNCRKSPAFASWDAIWRPNARIRPQNATWDKRPPAKRPPRNTYPLGSWGRGKGLGDHPTPGRLMVRPDGQDGCSRAWVRAA